MNPPTTGPSPTSPAGPRRLHELADETCRVGAERIKGAYDRALQDGRKTRDLGGDLGTEAFADAVIERLA